MKHLMRYIRGSSETVLVHMADGAQRKVIRAQADSDWAGCQLSANTHTRRSTSCGMIWWRDVLITSFARTQSTIATSSAESKYYGACACASEAVYVKELLKFIGDSHSSRARCQLSHFDGEQNWTRYLWLQQLVPEKTIKLVKVRGTQHPPDVGTKYLRKKEAGYVARQEHDRLDGAGGTSSIWLED
eukprot:6490679-Amphidinium_carterae.1